MSVYRDKRTGLWRIDFTWRGRRWTRKGYKSAAKARTAEQRWRDDLERGLSDPFPLFRDLLNAWLESGEGQKQARYLLQAYRQLERNFGHLFHLRPREITRGHVEPVFNRLRKTKKAATMNAYRRDLAAVLNFGMRHGAIPFNPVAAIPRAPEDMRPRRPIPTADLQALILAAKPQVQARLLFVSQTACRWVEMARLKWSEVHLDAERPFALLSSRKNRGGAMRQRPQPLTETAVRAIETMRGVDPVYVFPRYRGGMSYYERDLRALERLCDRAGVPRYSWHQIRHWGGFVASKTGKNRRAVADLLGHTQLSTTERYMHAITDEVWEIAGELERELGLPAPPPVGGAKGETRG